MCKVSICDRRIQLQLHGERVGWTRRVPVVPRPPQHPRLRTETPTIKTPNLQPAVAFYNTTSTPSGQASVHGIGEAGAERGGRVSPSTSCLRHG